MEVKSELLTLDKDIRIEIYKHLPFEALLLLRLVSTQTKNDSYEFFSKAFHTTNQLVFDYFSKEQNKPSSYVLYRFPDGSIARRHRPAVLEHPEADLKQCVEENPAFQKFIHDAYYQYLHCPIVDHQEKQAVSEPEYGTIYLTTIDKETLYCYAKAVGYLKFAHSCKNLTFETLRLDLKEKIQLEFGWNYVESVIDLYCIHHYLNCFNNPLFQYYYLNGQITFETMRHSLHVKNLDYLYAVKESLPYLKDYPLELSDFNATCQTVKQWILDNPKPKGQIYTSAEVKLLTNKDFFTLIRLGYASLEEALVHGDNLLQGMKIIQMPPRALLPQLSNHELMEFFCEGLSKDPQKVVKGRAIKTLYEYVLARTKAEEDSTFNTVINFFKTISSKDLESKVNAAKALIYALFGVKNLSDSDIKVLTQNVLFSDKEDRLTTIARTMVLEPLGLGSLKEINTNTQAPEPDLEFTKK